MTTGVVADDVEQVLAERIDWTRLAGKTVLVTGATGMVGQYVVRSLLELGGRIDPPQVVALTRQEARARRLFAGQLSGGSLSLLVQDVTAPIDRADPVDFVVHAASPANPVSFARDPVGVISANVTGTANVLSLAARTAAVVCFVSTLEIYGRPAAAEPGADVVVTEDTPGTLDSLDPRSAYPESKRLAETLCIAYGSQYGVGHRIARLSHTYGPGMDLEDSRIQSYVMRQALRGEDVVLQSDGTLRRTYTYISDAVSALFHLLCADADLTCNIANESAQVSIRELAETALRHRTGTSAALRLAEPGGGAPAGGVFLDCGRLRSLGWRARVDLEHGMARTMRHHREEAR